MDDPLLLERARVIVMVGELSWDQISHRALHNKTSRLNLLSLLQTGCEQFVGFAGVVSAFAGPRSRDPLDDPICSSDGGSS